MVALADAAADRGLAGDRPLPRARARHRRRLPGPPARLASTVVRPRCAARGIIGWRIHQSFFQRRVGLVTLVATTAGGKGSYEVPDVTAAEALGCADEAVPGLLTPFLARLRPPDPRRARLTLLVVIRLNAGVPCAAGALPPKRSVPAARHQPAARARADRPRPAPPCRTADQDGRAGVGRTRDAQGRPARADHPRHRPHRSGAGDRAEPQPVAAQGVL